MSNAYHPRYVFFSSISYPIVNINNLKKNKKIKCKMMLSISYSTTSIENFKNKKLQVNICNLTIDDDLVSITHKLN
jgi:hypothetical protein